MIAIFGQGKIWVPLQKLLRHFKIDSKSIDYKERDEELFENAEQIIVHQAVKPDSDIYKKYGHKTISELNFIGQLLAKQSWGKNLSFIGITGTDGKSTTTHVLYHLLKSLLPTHHLWISGNFDESLATTIHTIIEQDLTDKKHIIVTELSSFLLYWLKDLEFEYSIWTNLSPDHLNWHTDMKDYASTKYGLIQHTTKQAFVTAGVLDVLHEHMIELTHTIPVTIYGNTYPLENTQFVGGHNAGNLEVCYLVTKAVLADINSVSDEIIHAAMNGIKPLDHRIQLIREKDDIKFYDDSKATSSQALTVALQAFPKEHIVLIAWGSDKGDNFTKLGDLMKSTVGYGIFIGTTAPQFVEIAQKKWIPHTHAKTMEEAVSLAYEYAHQHKIHVVLMSPGCASFDMFKDYLDRAHHFIDAVKAL